jgi:hypothetical protein
MPALHAVRALPGGRAMAIPLPHVPLTASSYPVSPSTPTVKRQQPLVYTREESDL